MTGPFARVIDAAAASGARRFAAWDARVFRWFVEGPAAMVWLGVEGREGAERVLEAFVALGVEVIGHGYLDQASFRAPPPATEATLPGLLWARVIPEAYADGRPGARPWRQQVARLSELFNLAEGVLSQAPWVNRYVCAALGPSFDPEQLEPLLSRVLDPALRPAPAARFGGPFTTAILEPRSLDDDFLPGDMHLAAPAILCIHDRKRRGVHAGVCLRPAGGSTFLGLVGCLGPGLDEKNLPAVSFHPSGAQIGAHRVVIPRLGRVYRGAVARAGFVVLSAIDSQRLWIIDSP